MLTVKEFNFFSLTASKYHCLPSSPPPLLITIIIINIIIIATLYGSRLISILFSSMEAVFHHSQCTGILHDNL